MRRLTVNSFAYNGMPGLQRFTDSQHGRPDAQLCGSAHRCIVNEAAQLAGKVTLQCLRRRLDAARSRDVDGDGRQPLRVAGVLAEPCSRIISCAVNGKSVNMQAQPAG